MLCQIPFSSQLRTLSTRLFVKRSFPCLKTNSVVFCSIIIYVLHKSWFFLMFTLLDSGEIFIRYENANCVLPTNTSKLFFLISSYLLVCFFNVLYPRISYFKYTILLFIMQLSMCKLYIADVWICHINSANQTTVCFAGADPFRQPIYNNIMNIICQGFF
jgi:hypothetical protein